MPECSDKLRAVQELVLHEEPKKKQEQQEGSFSNLCMPLKLKLAAINEIHSLKLTALRKNEKEPGSEAHRLIYQ